MFFKKDKKNLGKYGEELACKYLKKQGLKIVETNYRTRAGEIDIIARDQESLVFVEVKTRKNTAFGYPEMNVHYQKLRHFLKSAELYLMINNLTCPYRFDVISIEFSSGSPDIKHFKNITF